MLKRYLSYILVLSALFMRFSFAGDVNTITSSIATDSKTIEVTFAKELGENLDVDDFSVRLRFGSQEELAIESADIKAGSGNKVAIVNLGADQNARTLYRIHYQNEDNVMYFAGMGKELVVPENANSAVAARAIDARTVEVDFQNPLTESDLNRERFKVKLRYGSQVEYVVESVAVKEDDTDRVAVITLGDDNVSGYMYEVVYSDFDAISSSSFIGIGKTKVLGIKEVYLDDSSNIRVIFNKIMINEDVKKENFEVRLVSDYSQQVGICSSEWKLVGGGKNLFVNLNKPVVEGVSYKLVYKPTVGDKVYSINFVGVGRDNGKANRISGAASMNNRTVIIYLKDEYKDDDFNPNNYKIDSGANVLDVLEVQKGDGRKELYLKVDRNLRGDKYYNLSLRGKDDLAISKRVFKGNGNMAPENNLVQSAKAVDDQTVVLMMKNETVDSELVSDNFQIRQRNDLSDIIKVKSFNVVEEDGLKKVTVNFENKTKAVTLYDIVYDFNGAEYKVYFVGSKNIKPEEKNAPEVKVKEENKKISLIPVRPINVGEIIIGNKGNFKDVENHWAKKYIAELSAWDIISGSGSEKFNPNGTITRAQFTKMIVRVMGLEGETEELYEDVDSSKWYFRDIGLAKLAGVTGGATESLFRPDDAITREEMAMMVSEAYERLFNKSMVIGEFNYNDNGDISDEAWHAVYGSRYHGIINGYPDNTFKPKDTANRAEAVKIIHMLISKIE